MDYLMKDEVPEDMERTQTNRKKYREGNYEEMNSYYKDTTDWEADLWRQNISSLVYTL